MLSEQIIAFKTIVRREVVRFMRIWTQTLLPPVITQSLYFIIFGKFIGSRIGEVQGVSYMAFIVPGLVMMSVISSSYSNVVSSFFSSKFQRSVEELLVSSTSNWVIMAGYVIGGVLRGICVGTLVFFVSILFTRPVIYHFGIIAFFMMLSALLFALAGLINGIYAQKFDDISFVPNFILTPLMYLGGVFYSIENLPVFWQNLSQYNPILYMVNGFRYGFYGFSDVDIRTSALILVFFVLSLGAFCLYLLKKGTGLKT